MLTSHVGYVDDGAGFYAVSLEPPNTITLRPTGHVVITLARQGERERTKEGESERKRASLY